MYLLLRYTLKPYSDYEGALVLNRNHHKVPYSNPYRVNGPSITGPLHVHEVGAWFRVSPKPYLDPRDPTVLGFLNKIS